jgi:GDPmannose 4,6-dehydratase
VKTPVDLVPLVPTGGSVQNFIPKTYLQVWSGEDWTQINAITATRRRPDDPDHDLLSIQARAGVVEVTAHHNMLDAEFEKLPAREVEEGDELALAEEVDEPVYWTVLTEEMAELLGLLAADGYVPAQGGEADFANNNGEVRARVARLWSRAFMGRATPKTAPSGWNRDRSVEHLRLTGARSLQPWLREQLYTPSGFKQVPPLVLNAEPQVQRAFLRGYYAGDGLKKGNGMSIKTNSGVLAQGLCWLYQRFDQPSSVYVEQRAGKTYYQLNLASAVTVGFKGEHLRRNPAEVRRVVPAQVPDDEWVFDIATESGRLCAGVGRLVISNSPRRGLEFVTRKITWHAAAIKLGRADKLRLGNLDAERDWGYAKDYVEAMWLMLQRDDAQDYVIATGVSHRVRDCLNIAFDQAGLDVDDHVVIDETLRRPAEVDHLIGDYSKAERDLGWRPTTDFESMIRLMVDADRRLLDRS